jgi:hypothetical protein
LLHPATSYYLRVTDEHWLEQLNKNEHIPVARAPSASAAAQTSGMSLPAVSLSSPPNGILGTREAKISGSKVPDLDGGYVYTPNTDKVYERMMKAVPFARACDDRDTFALYHQGPAYEVTDDSLLAVLRRRSSHQVLQNPATPAPVRERYELFRRIEKIAAMANPTVRFDLASFNFHAPHQAFKGFIGLFDPTCTDGWVPSPTLAGDSQTSERLRGCITYAQFFFHLYHGPVWASVLSPILDTISSVWGNRRPYYAFVKIQEVLYGFSQKIRLQPRLSLLAEDRSLSTDSAAVALTYDSPPQWAEALRRDCTAMVSTYNFCDALELGVSREVGAYVFRSTSGHSKAGTDDSEPPSKRRRDLDHGLDLGQNESKSETKKDIKKEKEIKKEKDKRLKDKTSSDKGLCGWHLLGLLDFKDTKTNTVVKCTRSPTECLRLHPASKGGITAAAVTRLLNDASFRCGTLKKGCIESFLSSL